jgi:orotate phosphoribosyltransferase
LGDHEDFIFMQTYKRDFIDFMMEVGVLAFGDFTTKSGRKTPYFVNTGLYRTGSQLQRLGQFYANAIRAELGTEFDVIFGPAYKGIPLVATTSAALNDNGHDVAFCFNRKEAKDHGEGGLLVGHKLTDGQRVLIIEDVTTAGTSIRETVPILKSAADIQLAGLVVSVDRAERGPTGDGTAMQEVGKEFAMPTFAIVTVHEIMQHVALADEDRQRMEAYLAEYGAGAVE